MAGKWSVLTQRQFEELTPQGTFQSVVEVSFQLTSGTVATVKIPSRLYSEDYVREQINTLADTMIAVENL